MKRNLSYDNIRLDRCVLGHNDYPQAINCYSKNVCSSPVFFASPHCGKIFHWEENDGVNGRKLGQWETPPTISEKIPSMVNEEMSDKTNGAINGWSELAESNLLWQF